MDQSIIFFFAAILLVGGLLFAFVCVFGKKGAKHLNVEHYRVKYLEIENRLKRDDASSHIMTVLNADKLLDQALRERGVKGETMGERMKFASAMFSDNNGVWSAHKLRNTIAHETEVHVTYDDARYALASFKKALKDLGAI